MKFTLRQLRYALAAAKHGNLTTAAMELHVSQPSISAAITELEEVLGQSIFVRQRGLGISLTPFGRTVMVQARRVLAEARTFAEINANAGSASANWWSDVLKTWRPIACHKLCGGCRSPAQGSLSICAKAASIMLASGWVKGR